jgi:hydroxyacyl-ACP dehydratase HTD2-like protein with hotdog domain
MWAGGSINFHDELGLLLNGQRAVCVEGIRNVRIKGMEGDEKVFVRIERRVAMASEGEAEDNIRARVWSKEEEDRADAVVIERRVLVFMRNKTSEQIKSDRNNIGGLANVARGKDPNRMIFFTWGLTPSRSSGTQKFLQTPNLVTQLRPLERCYFAILL